MSDEAYLNTDRELWREPKGDLPSDYYADSIHVTEQGGIGIDCGGTVYVRTLREWHGAAAALATAEARIKELEGERDGAREQRLSDHGYEWEQRARAAEAEVERLRAVVEEKPNQPLLNAARRLVLATDNAERNYALAALVAALDSEPQRGITSEEEAGMEC